MVQQDAFALGQSNLNGFLFADIGVESTGMPLSVISALARQGLDPWQEAGRLARLPRTVAADGLARLIAAMPASLWPMPDARRIAGRLVALLPGQDSCASVADAVSSSTSLPEAAVRSSNPWLIAAIVAIALLAGVATYIAPTPPTVPGSASPASSAPINSVPFGS